MLMQEVQESVYNCCCDKYQERIKIEFFEQTKEILLVLWKRKKKEEEEQEFVKTIFLFTFPIMVGYKWIIITNA